MRSVLIVVAALVLAIVVGGVVWAVAGDDERRSGALVSGPDLKSPNGLYSLDVRDDGIYLDGPAGDVVLSDAGVAVKAPDGTVTVTAAKDVVVKASASLTAEGTANATLKAGATAKVQGTMANVVGGTSSVQGASVALGCAGGGLPILRANDRVILPGNGPYGAVGPGAYPLSVAAPSGVTAC